MDIQYKTCTKCKKEKPLSEFYKNKNMKNGLSYWCKSCNKQYNIEYRKNNAEKLKQYNIEYHKNNAEKLKQYRKQYNKQWREENKNKIKEKRKQYRKENKNKIKKSHKQWREENKNKIKEKGNQYRKENKNKIKKYNKQSASFDTYAHQIDYAEKVRKSKEGHLEVKCTYCGKWFEPTNTQIVQRIGSLNGRIKGENRLYCSDSCKIECPIFNQSKYAKDQNKPATSREVQPELRQMVFERDNRTCIKCNSTKSLHCHHITGIELNPIESADIDNCVTLCKQCHKQVHKQKDCRYSDLRRSKCQ